MKRILKIPVAVNEVFMLENITSIISFNYQKGTGLCVWVEEDKEETSYQPMCYLVVPTGVDYEEYYEPMGSCITDSQLVFHLLADRRPIV